MSVQCGLYVVCGVGCLRFSMYSIIFSLFGDWLMIGSKRWCVVYFGGVIIKGFVGNFG